MISFQTSSWNGIKSRARHSVNPLLTLPGVILWVFTVLTTTDPTALAAQDMAQDKAAQDEAAQAPLEILPYDPELDAGSSPDLDSNAPKTPSDEDFQEKDEESTETLEMQALIAEDTNVIERKTNWLNFGLGYVRGNTPLNVPYYFPSVNIKYARVLKNIVFFKESKFQDAIAFEISPYFYKAINFGTQGDAYNVINLSGALRYDLVFSENFHLFFYGGVSHGFLISSNAPQANAVSALTLFQPAIGGGTLFQLGPGWYLRLEAGWDQLGFGLSLKF